MLLVAVVILWASVGPDAIAEPGRDRPRGGSPSAGCRFGGTTEARMGPDGADSRLHLLTDVRAGAHRCFDRAVFQFRPASDGSPGEIGYHAAYDDPPFREPGSGRSVEVDGDAFVVVRLRPVRDVELSGGEPRPTYEGPDSVRPRGGATPGASRAR
jgi:hypothetical protein